MTDWNIDPLAKVRSNTLIDHLGANIRRHIELGEK